MNLLKYFSGTEKKSGSNTITHIAEGTSLGGDLVSKSPIYFFGSITGDLQSEGDIFIGDNAEVLGDIVSTNLYLGGKVRGDIHCENFVYLKESAVVAGDLLCKEINIERGALVAGQLVVSPEKFVHLEGQKIKHLNTAEWKQKKLQKAAVTDVIETNASLPEGGLPEIQEAKSSAGKTHKKVKPVNSDIIIDTPTEEKKAGSEEFPKNIW